MEMVSKQRVPAQIEQSENRALGITAKSAAPLIAEGLQENRRNRFKFQSVASKVLFKDATKKLQKTCRKRNGKIKKHAGDIHRTCDCSWTALSDFVEVNKSIEFKTAHFKNLVSCGSVWACPICTAKIQERRRLEIASAMDQHYKSGHQVIMVTLTAPHYHHQSLLELRAMQRKALSSLRKDSGSFTRLLKSNGYIGLIRALEVTVSKRHGWHLHTHELWFVDKDADIERITERTMERWEQACYKVGLLNAFDEKQVKAFRKHSVDVKASVSCSDYLAKQDDQQHWGADREIAKSSTKSGRKKGFHPFGLLAEISESTENAAWAEKRFVEYCEVMKGSRQLFWSHGLKDRFGINDKSDEEIAAEEEDKTINVIKIECEKWKKIRLIDGAKATILDISENCSPDLVRIYVDSLG